MNQLLLLVKYYTVILFHCLLILLLLSKKFLEKIQPYMIYSFITTQPMSHWKYNNRILLISTLRSRGSLKKVDNSRPTTSVCTFTNIFMLFRSIASLLKYTMLWVVHPHSASSGTAISTFSASDFVHIRVVLVQFPIVTSIRLIAVRRCRRVWPTFSAAAAACTYKSFRYR